MAIDSGINHWDGGVPDVMCGEETQVAGAMNNQTENGLFVLPGTHSKWVITSKGRIEGFMTFMSGELFSVLVEHSILGRLIQSQ